MVIVANHQSYLDAPLIAACLPDSPCFAIHTAQAAKWYFKPFLAVADTFPVNVQSPYAVKRMVRGGARRRPQADDLPRRPHDPDRRLMKIYEGAAMVADKAHARIVPISIEGLQFSRLNRMRGRLRQRWFPPRAGDHPCRSVTLAPPDAGRLTPRQRREVIGRALQDVMVDAVFHSKDSGKTPVLRAAGCTRRIRRQDADRSRTSSALPITYDRLLLGAIALGRALTAAMPEETHVALLLPNAIASVVTVFGLQAFGVVPCLLNVTAGAANMLSACRAAGARTIVSSRAFVEKARLERVVERLAGEVRFIWLEDVRDTIGLRAKLRA